MKDNNNVQIAHIERHSSKPPPTKFTRRKTAAATMTKHGAETFGDMRKKFQDVSSPTLEEGTVAIELSNDADFCQQLLFEGFVQSFVDFYHLTHRPDPNAPDAASAPKIYTSLQDMAFIRDNLVVAETARRQGNTVAVYGAYTKLADLYAASMDWRTSIFFHDKCLEVSQLTADARAEMLANNSLGLVSQKMGDYVLARRYHERHEDIAKQYDVVEEVAKSNVELYKVYTVLARKEESVGHYDGALEMYSRCLGAAKRCFDKTAEGDANGKIGTIMLRRGGDTTAKCITFLREQFLIAQEMGNSEGKCNAASALALAYEALGEKEKALAELKMVHNISEHAGDAALQSKACRALGTLYSKVGWLEDAFEALKTHYHLVNAAVPMDADKLSTTSVAVNKLHNAVAAARDDAGGGMADVLATAHTATVKDLDLARSFLGVAKGNLIMGAYIVAIQSDLAGLLDWKLTRSDVAAKQENDLVPDRAARQERAAAGKKAVEAAEQGFLGSGEEVAAEPVEGATGEEARP